MFLLYRACANAFSKNVKAMAMVQGAENVDLDEDWYDSNSAAQAREAKVVRMHDMPNMAATGLSLGYETSS